MYTTAPSWSFPSKNKSQRVQQSPSPCGYFPEKYNTLYSPSWKIGTSSRNKQNKSVVPGPGRYQNTQSRLSKKYGKFNKENHHKSKQNQNPAPNSYSPNFNYCRPSTPGSKIQLKTRATVNQSCTPGPGQYQSSFYSKNNNANTKIGNQKRFFDQKLYGPGPETYFPNKDNFKSVAVGFTKQRKNYTEHVKSQLNSPGPGKYQTNDYFRTSVQQKRGYSISSKHKPQPANQNPSPGQYDPVYVSQPQSPKISMKGRHQRQKRSTTPGPGQYSVENVKNNTHGYSIGKSQRGFIDVIKSNPGPGSYNPQTHVYQTPKYSICGSRVQEQVSHSPGPGSYNPDKNKVKKRPQSAKIGNSKRCQLQKSLNPGPGQYNIKSTFHNSGIKFSRQLRNKDSREVVPGPADYNINQIIGHTTSYFRKV